MTEWTSISVTEEQKQAIEAAQDDADHDGAIGRFIVGAIETNESTTSVDVEQLAEELKEIIIEINAPVNPDKSVSSAKLVEMIEELKGAQTHTGPVQLEATEYRKIAEEVEGRLQR